MPTRLAIIDLGTSSARLLVADVHPDGTWQQVKIARVACRLGERLSETGSITPEAEKRAVAALQGLIEDADKASAGCLRIIATHALRAAENGASCLARLQEAIGRKIDLLLGEEEARLVFKTASKYGVPSGSRGWATLDLGGGSLELARASGSDMSLVSIGLGAVVLAHRLPARVPVSTLELQELRALVHHELLLHAADFEGAAQEVAAAGGTVTCAALLGDARTPLSGHRMSCLEVEKHLQRLAGLSQEQRARLRGVGDRADIIVPGLAVLCEATRFLGASSLIVLEHGVREGALLQLATEIF